jgi:hypothetical protein
MAEMDPMQILDKEIERLKNEKDQQIETLTKQREEIQARLQNANPTPWWSRLVAIRCRHGHAGYCYAGLYTSEKVARDLGITEPLVMRPTSTIRPVEFAFLDKPTKGSAAIVDFHERNCPECD